MSSNLTRFWYIYRAMFGLLFMLLLLFFLPLLFMFVHFNILFNVKPNKLFYWSIFIVLLFELLLLFDNELNIFIIAESFLYLSVISSMLLLLLLLVLLILFKLFPFNRLPITLLLLFVCPFPPITILPIPDNMLGLTTDFFFLIFPYLIIL